MLAIQVQAQVREIHSDSDDHFNGGPMSFGPIPSGMLKNLETMLIFEVYCSKLLLTFKLLIIFKLLSIIFELFTFLSFIIFESFLETEDHQQKTAKSVFLPLYME